VTKKLIPLSDAQISKDQLQSTSAAVHEFTKINNLILETDYYKEN